MLKCDSIVKVLVKKFEAGPQNHGKMYLEEFVCSDPSVRDMTEEELAVQKKQPSWKRNDVVLLEPTYGFQFACFGESMMTGIDCEVEAAGWAGVVESELPKLVEIADRRFEEAMEPCDELVFLTLWGYSASGECGMVKELKMDEMA